MVRAGSFLDLKPMAEANVLNLRVGRASLGLEDELEAVEGYFSSSSTARLEADRLGRKESLEDLERDHHGLPGFGEESGGGIRGRTGKESGLAVGLIKGSTAEGRDQ